MDYLTISVLALIQGITEFLPVSSSGHLVLAQRWLGWTIDNVLLDAVLHLGTAAAIIIIYRKDIQALFEGVFSRDRARRKPSLKYVALILIATVPAGIAGVAFKRFFERMFLDAEAAGVLFFVTAGFPFRVRTSEKAARRSQPAESFRHRPCPGPGHSAWGFTLGDDDQHGFAPRNGQEGSGTVLLPPGAPGHRRGRPVGAQGRSRCIDIPRASRGRLRIEHGRRRYRPEAALAVHRARPAPLFRVLSGCPRPGLHLILIERGIAPKPDVPSGG